VGFATRPSINGHSEANGSGGKDINIRLFILHFRAGIDFMLIQKLAIVGCGAISIITTRNIPIAASSKSPLLCLASLLRIVFREAQI
jgi:hypothetical protein